MSPIKAPMCTPCTIITRHYVNTTDNHLEHRAITRRVREYLMFHLSVYRHAFYLYIIFRVSSFLQMICFVWCTNRVCTYVLLPLLYICSRTSHTKYGVKSPHTKLLVMVVFYCTTCWIVSVHTLQCDLHYRSSWQRQPIWNSRKTEQTLT